MLSVCGLLFFVSTISAQDNDWRPIPAEDLAAKTATVEPDADAEALFWEVRVDDSSAQELALRHYVRIKIFTERGREQFSKHDVVFTKGTKVKDVEARVTKPDGSTVFLTKEDVIERDIVKASGVKVRAKTFALPGLEIGSIIEYRYKEVINNAEANMRLIFQREVPIRTVSYFVKPFSGERGLYYEPFNVGNTKFEKNKNGFYRATMTNVPAFREEPSMMPEDDVKSWIYIYYSATQRKNAAEYWKDINRFHYEHSKETMKPNDEIKRITAETIAGATTDDEKLRRIYDYTKSKIRNLNYADKVNEDEWKKVLQAKTPGDTLKLGYGSSGHVDNFFGAMARAAGFDAREALSGSRNEMIFDRNVPNASLMINSQSVAINIGGTWRFFSPGGYWAPYGMLSWAEEGQSVLITDSKEPIWDVIKLSAAEKSREKRTGRFKLLPDGTLEGEATIEYTGHWAAFVKNQNRGDSAVEQENYIKDRIKSNVLGTSDVADLTIQNISDPEKPLVYKFKIRVPGYASRTGKRIFFQPNVFERSAKPRFTAGVRKYDVYISYPFSEEDDVTIHLPAGFALENADAPQPIEDSQGIGSHKVSIGVTQDGSILVYKRHFVFGNNGFVRFPAKSYPAVKSLFEAFNQADVHQLTLREGAVAGTK
jgi:hypothetical protein